MSDTITFAARSGSVLFDFDNKKIVFDRAGGLAATIGLVSMEINMQEVTAIELRQPTMMKLGAFNIIVNHTRYVTQTGQDATHFALSKKAEFPALQNTLQRVLGIAGLPGFMAENQTQAQRVVYDGSMNDDAVFSFTNNTHSTLKVYTDHLVINHAGAINYFSKGGLKGEKRINFASISSIECRKATTMAAGFIQFSIMGAGIGGGVTSAAGDENSILFDATKNNLVQQIIDYIETRRAEISMPQPQQVVNAVSAADELKKFKELLDMGVITQEEFDAKKKQLLGL